MIRRFRVGLKRPIYADEAKAGLMPSLFGVPVTRYRILFVVLAVFLFYTWHSQSVSFEEQVRRKDAKIESLRREYESVSEKLRVIWLHKKKLEATINAQQSESDKFTSRIKLKDSEIYGLKSKNEQCLKELSDCNNEKHSNTNIKSVEENKQKENDVLELRKQLKEVQEQLENKDIEMNTMSAILKDELKQCEDKIKQLTGGGAVEHYSQNETAHFSRNHKADEPLSFDRANIKHHMPDKLLMGRQLAETIEEARVRKLEDREQMEKHPQDREQKDHEVNEQPDKDEQDYKEQ